MSKYALINSKGIVENVVLWDGKGNLFSDYVSVNVDEIDAGIGWTYAEGDFLQPDYEGDLSGGDLPA